MYLYPSPQYNGPVVIMQESGSARGEAVTSGPRPLTWNLGKLNPAKGGVVGLTLSGGGSSRGSEWKNRKIPRVKIKCHLKGDNTVSGSGKKSSRINPLWKCVLIYFELFYFVLAGTDIAVKCSTRVTKDNIWLHNFTLHSVITLFKCCVQIRFLSPGLTFINKAVCIKGHILAICGHPFLTAKMQILLASELFVLPCERPPRPQQARPEQGL